jgi:cyanophycin synthetase
MDLVVPDIRQPFTSGGIVEVNASPGIRMHHFPGEGEPRDVGGAIVNMLYPAGQPSSIPIISITGTNGKTTVTRMIAHLIGTTGKTVGRTTTDGIWINGEEIARGDMTGPWSAGVVLSDSGVEVAVLETARGGIMRSGLGYDWSDIGVMTNIQPDHIGQDGIESLEDIVRVKRLVAERVRRGGTLILNADDEHLAHLPAHGRVAAVAKNIVYFSLDNRNPVIRHHLESGGTAYVAVAGSIEERRGAETTTIAELEDVPATVRGTAEFQIYNVLAAVAAARAYGLQLPDVANGVRHFRMEQHSPGRLNVLAFRDGFVVVDYGHNPVAVKAIQAMISNWSASRRTAVVAFPGDRQTDLIVEAARAIAQGYDRVFVREDADLRGRRPGEVADIIARTIREDNPHVQLETILDELDATISAVCSIVPGEIVVTCSDRIDAVTDGLFERGARPATDVEIGILTGRVSAMTNAA